MRRVGQNWRHKICPSHFLQKMVCFLRSRPQSSIKVLWRALIGSQSIFVRNGLMVIAAAAFFAAQAQAGEPFMRLGAATSQPIGHYEFCQRLPQECLPLPGSAGSIHLTQAIWDSILEVNYTVNHRLQPETDMVLYGREEYWAYPTTAGDCEDYVLQKRRELAERDLPLSALLITVVRKPDGEGHALLTIHTDRGDLVLDNLRDDVLSWSETEYIFLKRQSNRHAGRWLRIEQPEDLLVSAVSP